MKKSVNIFLLGLVFFLSACKGDPKKNHQNNVKIVQEQTIDFDKVLKAGDYSWNEAYFITADYGILYDPQGANTWGNLIIYLVPRMNIKIDDEQIEEENTRVNDLSVDGYKEIFKIYIFLIDKEDLNHTQSGDPEYYQKSAYTEKLYTYNDKMDKWIFVDSIRVLSEGENQKERIWREKYISDHR